MKLAIKKQRLAKTDQVLFLKELAELGQAGYSVNQSLNILLGAHRSWQVQLEKVQEELGTGNRISSAFAPLFDSDVQVYLRLAEEQGRFSETMQELASKMQLIIDYKRQLKAALTYPAILLIILFALVFGLEKTLYPVFATLTETLGQGRENFALTVLNILLGIVLLVCAVVVFSYLVLIKVRPVRRCHLVARIPYLRALSKSLISALLAEQLALLLKAGLTLPAIIATFAQEGKKSLAQEMAREAQLFLKEGQGISSWIDRQPYLNQTLSAYLSRGFNASLLATYLSYFAKHEFRDFDRRIKRLFAWIQPILFAVIGAAIVLLYLAMLLPLYKNLGGIQT
ncbi:hypothetical protein G6R29_03825 [Fructobacillus sp. M2-14]|uniref:Type II secretion system protein GspF domain-containing protein n=1 Tax=Fructobacillus broussonetiae TaxID=2713173 RepID=A0ABS5R0L3_9LACO|nr:type II secretion system F family protein [Fructobacillus broussonetiae]MBS9338752.1 hypothetical protein [Fructobacillus broussonetiae]